MGDMMRKRFQATIAVLFCSIFMMMGQTVEFAGLLCPYRLDTLAPLTPSPEGYEPFYINHYGRHGSRYSTHQREMEYCLMILEQAAGRVNLTPVGDSLYRRVSSVILQHKDNYGALTRLGIEQHYGIADRMYHNFPEVMAPGSEVRSLSSILPRCLVSQAAFISELRLREPSLSVMMRSSEQLQPYANIKNIRAVVRYSDSLSLAVVLRTSPAKKIIGLYFKKYPASIDDSLFLTGLYHCAASSANLEHPEDIFALVPEGEKEYMRRLNNVRAYLITCNSAERGCQRMARADSLLGAMIQRADDAVSVGKNSVDLCFGHDYVLLTLLSCFAVDGMPQGLDAMRASEEFDAPRFVRMASNLQCVFYKPSDWDGNVSRILVKVLLNEKECTLNGLEPVCGSVYYNWSELRKYLSERIS